MLEKAGSREKRMLHANILTVPPAGIDNRPRVARRLRRLRLVEACHYAGLVQELDLRVVACLQVLHVSLSMR